jgi:hypothetical protein
MLRRLLRFVLRLQPDGIVPMNEERRRLLIEYEMRGHL